MGCSFGVQGVTCRMQGAESGEHNAGCRFWGAECRIWGAECGVLGMGSRVQNTGSWLWRAE